MRGRDLVPLLVALALVPFVAAGSASGKPPACRGNRVCDTTPPAAPTNLHSTGATQTSVSLAWDAATDNVGVTGYDVFVDSGNVASTSATSYTATGLACGSTHAFGVAAYDAARNHSTTSTVNASTAACSTPPPPPPPPPPPASDPVIAAAGDIACDPTSSSFNGGAGTATDCHQKATSDLVVGGGATAILSLGDTQYENNAYAKYLDSFDPSWGRVKSLIHPATGNHEYLTAGAAGYFQYFGAAAGPSGKGYYSYDIGAWHLIALNSNCSEVGGCGVGSPQEVWLTNDLSASAAKCTLAYWHHPRWSSGPHGSSATYDAFWKDLYAANADVVLVGHDHDYERFAPQNPSGGLDTSRGIREFVVGTGGKSHYAFATIRANSEVRNADTYGVLKLTLHASSYDWRFVPEAGKTFSDSGTTACH